MIWNCRNTWLYKVVKIANFALGRDSKLSWVKRLALFYQNVSRAGSVKNHNLLVADGRWYGKSLFLRHKAVRIEEAA